MKLGFIPGIASPELEQDWDGTLAALAQSGYQGVELNGKAVAMRGGNATEVRKSVEGHGMTVMSYFSNWGAWDKEAESEIDNALALGCDHIVWGWAPANDPAYMENVFPVMHKAASMAKAAGLRFIYHNHAHEFERRDDGQLPLDWMLGHFHPDLIACELDVGWVAFGGEDPAACIRDHAGRCPILHLRDLFDMETKGAFIEIGEGLLDFDAILTAGKEAGRSEWAVVEHTKQLEKPALEGLDLAARNLARTGHFDGLATA